MQRIDIDRLQPGDIILTANRTKAGKLVRVASKGIVSHAMICVQHGSIIDSTADGVQAWNLQREFFRDDEAVFVFRLRNPLLAVEMARVVDFARAEIGTGLVTVLRRSPERLELAAGDRRDDQAFRRVQAGGGAHCADQWSAA